MGALFAEIKKRAKDALVRSDDLLIIALIVLVGSAGFGLGRLSMQKSSTEPVSIEYFSGLGQAAEEGSKTVPESTMSPEQGEVVASRNGTKYHYPWCSGAQRIKEENKIWFASIAAAQAAGYTAAANCKGLE